MLTTKQKNYYHLAFLFAITGNIWLLVNILMPSTTAGWHVCFFKNITGLPCPSCGGTRSAVHIVHGDFIQAMAINPLGLVIVAMLIIFPLGYIYDMIQGKLVWHGKLLAVEQKLKQPRTALIFILLVIANWAWNIYKHL